MARFIEYEEMLKNSCGILDILNEEDLYITEFTLNRMYNDNPELEINFDTYATNDLYLKALIKDKYFIEEKEIEGNMVKVYNTPFRHKIMVADNNFNGYVKEEFSLEPNKAKNLNTAMIISACIMLLFPLFLIYLILK